MKLNALSIVVVIVILFSACGGGSGDSSSNDVVLKLNDVKITGDLKEHLKVVPGEYKIEKNKKGEVIIPLKFELLEKVDGWNENSGFRMGDGFKPTLLDANGIPLEYSNNIYLDLKDYDRMDDLLQSGAVGDQQVIRIEMNTGFDESISSEDWKVIKEKAKGLEILRTVFVNVE